MITTMLTSCFISLGDRGGPRRIYSAAIGTIASVAPTLGPVIGGWITDTLNWRWLFYTRWMRMAGNAGHLGPSQVRVAFDNEASYSGSGTNTPTAPQLGVDERPTHHPVRQH